MTDGGSSPRPAPRTAPIDHVIPSIRPPCTVRSRAGPDGADGAGELVTLSVARDVLAPQPTALCRAAVRAALPQLIALAPLAAQRARSIAESTAAAAAAAAARAGAAPNSPSDGAASAAVDAALTAPPTGGGEGTADAEEAKLPAAGSPQQSHGSAASDGAKGAKSAERRRRQLREAQEAQVSRAVLKVLVRAARDPLLQPDLLRALGRAEPAVVASLIDAVCGLAARVTERAFVLISAPHYYSPHESKTRTQQRRGSASPPCPHVISHPTPI